MAQAESLTSTTGLSPIMTTYYKETFLSHFEEKLVASKMGQAQPVPLNKGKTVDWFRYHALAKVTAQGSEGDVGAYTYKSLQGFNVTGTLETWYDQIRFAELLYLTARDPKLTQGIQLLGQQAGESIERETIKVVAERNIFPIHGGAVTSAGVQSATFISEDIAVQSFMSSTVFRLSDSTIAFLAGTKRKTNSLKGSWLCISKGAGYGHCSRITAYSSVFASAGHSVTLSVATPESVQSQGSTKNPTKVTIAGPMMGAALLTSSHKMTTPLIQKAEEILFKNGAEPYEDGYYAGLVHPAVYRQLLADPMFQRAMQNGADGFGTEGMRMNEIGIWGKVRFYRMTTAARYAVTSATYTSFSETVGNAYLTFICGRNGWGTIQLEGRGEPELSIKIPNPNDNNTENVNNLFGVAGWKLYWKAMPLNANFVVGIFTYI